MNVFLQRLTAFSSTPTDLSRGGQAAYEKYLDDINVPDIYGAPETFFDRYVFDLSDPNSIISNLDRALGNGIVLREEIKTPSLAYLQCTFSARSFFRKNISHKTVSVNCYCRISCSTA